jgi:cytochrome P450
MRCSATRWPAYDEMRERGPVAYSEFLGWSLFRHADVVRALNDPQTFSSAVSGHRAVPSGMDPPEHSAYRPIVERYFQPEYMAAFEPECRQIAANLVDSLLGKEEVEFCNEFTEPFAVQAQCAFLGWPQQMHEPLHHWPLKSHDATFAQNRIALRACQRVRRLCGPVAAKSPRSGQACE